VNPELTTQNSQPVVNALTIDVEDYFQVSAFEAVSPPASWEQRELRVEANTDRILALLDERGVRATFFVLGWVAERCGELVKRIAAAGHEVASHGYGHRRVYHQSRAEFREDIRRGKTLLEGLTGEAVLGYRAPSYSISQACLWAFDELSEAGFLYDSSVFPIRHDLYGMPDWPRFVFRVERLGGEEARKLGSRQAANWVPAEPEARLRDIWAASPLVSKGTTANSQPLTVNCAREVSLSSRLADQPTSSRATLLEVPITTLRLLGKNLPISGGGYFRLFPYGFTHWGLQRINRVDGQPFVFYLHPWELDPGQPRMDGAGLKSRFRHYLNLGKTEARFARLLDDFTFAPIRAVAGIPVGKPRELP